MPRTNENTKPTTRITCQTTNSNKNQTTAKPITKPAAKPVAKPAATKPVAKPAAAKPATTKHIAKPATIKPVTKAVTKPAATKPITKPKKPAAVNGAKILEHPLQDINTNRELNSDSESDSDLDTDSKSNSESDGDECDASHTAQRLSRAAMEKKMATQDAQLACLRKKVGQAKAAKNTKKQKKSLIPQPKPLGNLQSAMRLMAGKSERREYLNAHQQVFTTLVGLGVNPATDTFCSFSHIQLAQFINVLKDKMPIFSRYEDAWPIPNLIQSVIKNKRHHLSRMNREVEDANGSDNNNITNRSHDDDSITSSPNAPATPGNNAREDYNEDDNLTLPAHAYFSSLSPFSATTNFQWHELEAYANRFEHNAQADSDDNANDNEDRVFGGRNTSSYIRRSRFNYAENEDDNSEDEDVEMEGGLDVEHGDDEDMENREDEGGEGEGDEGEGDEGEGDKSEDEQSEDEDDEEVTIVIKRKALSALKDARCKKKFKV
ncbi:hypothetical protein BJ165DRAFT_1408613 [Panaeolus papilionaceus]|nr:hypothetical protein BJ165DRAFT_1408613 [Panaeolus papilionaceus]